MIVVQETLALAQSPMPLHWGPTVGQEPNEMATKHFLMSCLCDRSEDCVAVSLSCSGRRSQPGSVPRACPPAWHHREEHMQWERKGRVPIASLAAWWWVLEKEDSAPCPFHPTPMPSVIFQLGLYFFSWMMLSISALV